MTEAEWSACDDPRPLLEHLGEAVDARTVRLFVLACCHRLWDGSTDDLPRLALELVERFVEAPGQRHIWTTVRVPAGEAVIDCGASEPIRSLRAVAADSDDGLGPTLPASSFLEGILDRLACWRDPTRAPGWLINSFEGLGLPPPRQAELLRDLVRGPFRPLVFRAAWRTANGGAVANLAWAIADEEAFDRLPILADALEDAGCAEPELLGHLRGGGPHVRGWWALDLVLVGAAP
jgi:hypothetical protein